MSTYVFSPYPDYSIGSSYAWQDGVFTEEELNQIVEIGDSLPSNKAGVVNANLNDLDALRDIRETQVSWIGLSKNTEFIFSKLANCINYMNGKYFQYDLFGFAEQMQYTVYKKKNHYTWHVDSISNTPNPPRKLSAVMLLSSPEDYKGGDLELFYEDKPKAMDRVRGRLFLFPSFVLHRVTPVTKGVRKSLVIWVSGNKFR